MTRTTVSRRTFSAAAASAFGLAAMHRVADVAAQDGEVAIEYWHRQSGDAAARLDQLAAAFNEEFADKVSVSALPQGGIQELNQKVRTAAAGGGLPAALMADDSDVNQYAASDIIVDIDPYIADPENGLSDEEFAAFLPSQIDRHKLEIYGNRRMAFPQGFSAATLFWNEDMLQAAGFDAPIATWAELPEHARALKAANPDVVPYGFLDAGAKFITTMMTYGVDWLKEDSATANFDAPEALEIMQLWKELYDEGLMEIYTEGAVDVFASGACVYMMDSSGAGRGIAVAEPTFAWSGGLPFQGSADGDKRTETYGPLNTIPKTDDAHQLAGWLWIKWLTSPAALTEWIAQTSYFPSVPAVAEESALAEFYETYPVVRKLVDDVAPYAVMITPHAALTEIRGTIVANIVNEVLLGMIAPEEGVQKLQTEANAAIERSV